MASEMTKDRDNEAYERGLALLGEGRFEEGIEALRGLSGRMPEALGQMAYAYYARGDTDSALPCLERYVERVPEDPSAWSLLARLERGRGDLPRAQQHARRAVDLGPNDARLWFELGEVFLQAQNWKHAVRAYRKCLKRDPSHTQASTRRTVAGRMVWRDRIRAVTWRPPASWILRRVLSTGLMAELIEMDLGITLDDRRWRMPLNGAGAADSAGVCPTDQTPERFETHVERCRCVFWEWFRSLPLDGRVREVLEAGVGSGHLAHHFAGGGFDVFSVTPSELARRERLRRGIRAVRGDLHFICRRGDSFDLIVAGQALRSVRSPLFALWEWRRLLRPDGYLFVAQPLHVDTRSPEQAPGEFLTLTYWQMRWLFKQANFQLIAEALEDPDHGCLETVEHVDGRRPPEPAKAWNALFLLRKPGTLPYDGTLEKPRRLNP